MNRDCRPNTVYRFDRETFTPQVHAVRAIRPGEEITISHISPIQPAEKQLAALERSWGFSCRSSACTVLAPVHAASDTRIAEIERLHHELADTKEEHDTTPEMAEHLAALCEQERLWADVWEPHAFAALEHNAVGNKWAASMWARRAVEGGTAAQGEGACWREGHGGAAEGAGGALELEEELAREVDGVDCNSTLARLMIMAEFKIRSHDFAPRRRVSILKTRRTPLRISPPHHSHNHAQQPP